jgi:hypothetical protein
MTKYWLLILLDVKVQKNDKELVTSLLKTILSTIDEISKELKKPTVEGRELDATSKKPRSILSLSKKI